MNRLRIKSKLLVFIGVAPLLSAMAIAEPPVRDSGETESGSISMRREGTHVELEGHFTASGERATFLASDDSLQIKVLENLALDRVMRMVREAGSRKLSWKIEGRLTEFQDHNYLLIEYAVVIGRESRNAVSP